MAELEYDDVCVLIPTYNEEATIGDVVDDFREQGFDHLLVVDGHSTDATREIAAEKGAEVITQSGRGAGSGKGEAVREGIEYIDRPIVLMLDGDGTYRAEDAHTMLEPILAGRAEHVIGNRFADMESGAMTRLNRFGNAIIDRAYHFIHGPQRMDILSGYRAFTKVSVSPLHLTAQGFGIETELAVECAKHGVPMAEVPIRYLARPDASETNLNPLTDGGIILLTLYRLAKTNNPLFYFGSVGTISSLVGTVLGIYVGVEWFTRGISHEVIAVVSALAILFGVQLLIFGFLSDMIVTLHREQLRRMEHLADGPETFTTDGDDTGSDEVEAVVERER